MSNLLFQRFFLPFDFTPASREIFSAGSSTRPTHHFQLIQTEPATPDFQAKLARATWLHQRPRD